MNAGSGVTNAISGCAPISVNFNNTTAGMSCGPGLTYNWTVLDSLGNIVYPGAAYNYLGGTSDTSKNPIIKFEAPNKYQIRLTASSGICNGESINLPVTVLGVANVSLPSMKTYCGVPKTIDFGTDNAHKPTYNNSLAATNESYAWSVTGGAYSFESSTTATSRYPVIKFTAYGTYTVSLTYTNSCGSVTSSQQIRFDEQPVANAGIDTTVCYSVNSISISGAYTGPGASYAWTSPSGGTFSSGTTLATTYTFSASDKANGSVTLTFAVTPPPGSACISNSDTRVVTIRPNNTVTNAVDKSICNGESVAYTPTASLSGSTFSWTSSVSLGSATGNNNGSGPITDILSNSGITNAVVTYIITPEKDGCSGTASAVRVTVKPTAQISGTASSSPTSCGGSNGSITLTLSIAGTYTVTYMKDGVAQPAATLATGAGGTIVISGLSQGSYSNFQVTLNGCPSAVTAGPVVLVDPSAPAVPTASSNSPVCSGSNLSFTANSATPGVSYSWTGPGFGTANSSQNPSISGATTAASGSYTVKVTKDGCSAQATISVTVNPTPSVSSIPDAVYCAGASVAAGSFTVTPATGTSFSWTNSNTAVGLAASGNGNLPAYTATNAGNTAISGQVSVVPVYTNGADQCVGAARNFSITVNPFPTVNPVGSQTLCNGAATNPITFSGAVANTVFNWTNSNNTIGIAASGTSNIASFNAINSGSTTVTANLSVTPAFTNAGLTCTGAAQPFSITINPTPTVNTIGDQTLCNGASSSAVNFTGALTGTDYDWTNSNTSIGLAAAGSGSIPSFVASNTGATDLVATITVTPKKTNGTDPACTGTSRSFTITVNATPAITAVPHNPTTCGGSDGSIVISGLSAGTYSVSYKRNGSTVSLGNQLIAGSTFTIGNLTSATYSEISVTRNGCRSNDAGPFTLSDPSAPAAPAPSVGGPICSGQTLQLNAATVPNATYSWSGPNSYSSTQQNPQIVNASTAYGGTYSVTVTVAGCSSPAGTVSATVNQTPAVPVITAPDACSNNTLTLTATSSTGGVDWSWTGPLGFTANSATATVPNAPTTASGNYTVTATLGSCSSNANINATVKPTPQISATHSNPTTCAGSDGSITISGLQAGIYTVSYERNSVAVSLSNQTVNGTTLTISGLSAGVYDHIRVTLDGCPSDEVGPLTLSDPAAPAAPGATANGPICAGSQLQLNTPTVSNATYSWTGPNSFSNNNQNPEIDNATTVASGTYSVTITVAGCTSPAGTVSVLVNPTPAQPTISSNQPVCEGSALTLAASTSTPGTMTWSWIGPGTYTSNQQNISFGAAGTAQAGNYSVTATLGVCPSPAGTLNVSVKPTPVISGTLFSSPTDCNTNTGTITLQGLATNTNFQVSYTRNSGTPVVQTLTSSGSGVLLIPGLSSGTYDAVFVTLDGCPSAPVGPFQLVDPNPPTTPVAGNSGPVCSGGSLTLTSTSDAGATYSWSGPGGYTNNTQNPVLSNIALSDAGTYSVTATLNGCVSAAAQTTVTVNRTPATPVMNATPVCSGNTLVLEASSDAGATYSWSGPSFTSALQNPTIANATSANAGTYTVLVTLGSCNNTGSIQAVVKPTPVITGTSTNPANCNTATGSITLQGLTAPGSYTVTYTFNGAPRTLNNQSPAAGGQLVIPSLASGVYDNVQVSVDGCPSNLIGPFNLQDPTPPTTPVAGNGGPVCSGQDVTLTATSDAGVTWSWSGPGGYTNTSQNPLIQAAPLSAAGTYSVTATLNGCTSAAGTTTLIVNETPAIPVLSATDVCSGNMLMLTASSSTAGVTYSWSGPSFTSADQNPTIANATAANAGVYTATVTLGTCTSSNTVTAVVKPTPVITGTFSNPVNCNTPTGSISIGGLAPGTYTVTYELGGAPVQLTSQSPDVSGTIVLNGLAAGQYEHIRVVLNGCPSNEVGPFTLQDPNPPAAPVVGSNGPLCVGSTLDLTASPLAGGVYSWTGPNGFTSTLQNPSISNAAVLNSGVYTVTVTLNNCVSQPASVTVVVNALAAAPAVVSPIEYCIDVAATSLTATTSAGSTLNWYTTATGGSPLPAAPVPPTATPGTTSWYVSQTSPAGCEGARAEIQVIVRPDADAQFTFAQDTSCWPFLLPIQNTSVAVQNGSYNWYANGVLFGATTSTAFPGYTLSNASEQAFIKLVAVSAFGCKPDSTEHSFYTWPKPQATFTATPLSGCGPLSVTFTNTTPLVDTFGYSWDFGNGQVSGLQQPGTVIFNSAPSTNDTTYHVTLRAFNSCDTTNFTVDIRVSSKPRVLFTPSSTNGCSPMRVVFANTSLGMGNSYEWIWDDGTPNTPAVNTDPVTHIFHTAVQDTFYVKLVATNQCGSDTATYAIIVAPNPIQLFMAINGTQQSGCAPHTVQFINNTVGAVGFQWNFADGNSLNTTDGIDTVWHTFLNPGTYDVTLTAVNSCTDTTMTVTINVLPKPGAAFSADRQSICLGDTIRFTNTSSAANSYEWSFGDGNTSTLTNPAHAYTAAGSYTVQLVAFRLNSPGNICTDTARIQVQVNSPAGAFSYAGGYVCGGRAVRFDANVTGTDTLIWNFGNGVTQATLTPFVYYTYPNPGLYVPSVTLASAAGCRTLLTGTDTIRVERMVGGFAAAQARFCGATRVTFTDTSHIYFGIREVRWDFGDGTGATGTQVTHDYASSGNYNIRQIIFSNSGCSDTVQRVLSVTVSGIPVATIDAQPQACARIATTLLANVQSVDPITLYEWSVNGTVQSSANLYQVTFNTPGSYAIRLVVGTVNGCFDTAHYTMVVNPTPVVTASPDAALCYGGSTQLNATGNGVLQWNWTPIQGLSCTTCSNPVATPNATTPYIVTGTNTFGCPGIDTVVITVHGPIHITVSDDDTICIGQSVQLLASGAASYVWRPDQYLDNDSIPNPVATPPVTIRYQVVGYDGWNCYTDTADVVVAVGQYPTVNLGPDLVLATGVQRPLVTTVTNGPIRNWLWAPAADLSCSSCPLPTATIRNDVLYTVQVTNNYGCSASDSLIIKAFCKEAQVFLPNAFSPDGDGVNDVFMVQGSGILRVKTFRVFNRWGELVFEKNEVPPNDPRFGWDGRVIGRPAAPDVYVYTVEVLCENGTPYTYKGNVTILK